MTFIGGGFESTVFIRFLVVLDCEPHGMVFKNNATCPWL